MTIRRLASLLELFGRALENALRPGIALAAILLVLLPLVPASAQSLDDTDGDGIADPWDNCALRANPEQADTDADRLGNACDPDFDNDGFVGPSDFAVFLGAFGSTSDLVDLTGDGFVAPDDFGRFLASFGGPPGPGEIRPPEESIGTPFPAVIDGFTFRGETVIAHDVDGDAIYEGDILLGRTEDVHADNPVFYGIVRTNRDYWEGGVVPFEIAGNFPAPTPRPGEASDTPTRIRDAMRHWEDLTAIQFVERTSANASQYPDWVVFQPHATACRSFVGRNGGRQAVDLAAACSEGSIKHEIGHAVGLWHEQSREDRDEFVTVHFENVLAGADDVCFTGDENDQCHNFDQHIADGDDVGDYDYGSIMHYPRTAFSKNGAVTIQPVDPNASIGQRDGLSAGDRSTVASIYGPNIVNQTTYFGYRSTGDDFVRAGYQRFDTQLSGDQRWVSGDFDRDGRDDFAQIYPDPFGNWSIMVYTANGSVRERSFFSRTTVRYDASDTWKAADLDGDGFDDLVNVGGYNVGAILSFYRSTGTRFVLQNTYPLEASFWAEQKWETGDVNGDGRDEVVLVYGHATLGTTVWVLTRTENGMSRIVFERPGGSFWNEQRWRLGDMDGDGLDDLVLVYGHATYGATAWIFRSYGTGFHDPLQDRLDAGCWDEQRWEIGNFDGDADDDLVLIYGHATHGATAFLYESHGSGFQDPIVERLDAGFWDEQRWMLGDADGDGLDEPALFYARSE